VFICSFDVLFLIFSAVIDNYVVCMQMPLNGNLSVSVNYRTNVIKVVSSTYTLCFHMTHLQVYHAYFFQDLPFHKFSLVGDMTGC